MSEPTTELAPMKKVWTANPVVRCSSGSMSPTKARIGSIVTLMEASMIHSIPAANHRPGELGITRSASEARMRAGQKVGFSAAEPVPGLVAHVADDRLHHQSRDRAGDPKDGNLVHLRAEGLEDPTDVRVLQGEAELDADVTEAHVPELPKTQEGFLAHGLFWRRRIIHLARVRLS